MTITVTLPDNSKKTCKKGSTPLDVAHSISEGLMRATVGAVINNEIVDATKHLNHDCTLKLITFKDEAGVEIFRHSSAHLLAQAVTELFPEAKLTIGPVVEEGFYYDIDHPPFTQEDLDKIEARMTEIVNRKLEVKRLELSKEEALKMFKDNKYKVELITEIPGKTVSVYQQGEFKDLCTGPHVPNTSHIKAFKLTKMAGAYWRGDAKNKQLQRIYGISFPDKKLLKEYLAQIEEALKRDHRKVGRELDLISFQEESPGAAFFHPKGTVIFNELQKFIREQYWKRGFKEVVTPLVYDKSLWETSGHWAHYKDNMFTFTVDNKEVSLKPMNCPSHCLLYKTDMKSYRDLPLRIADFAPLHRNELRGVLGGLTRVRKFQQDDAHIFCTLDQLDHELDDAIDFANVVYTKVFNFEYRIELSTRPENSMGTAEQWERAEAALKAALEKNNIPYKLNPGDGAFYGPKIDLHIKDCIGRSWQLSTIQVDFQLPQRFGLTYEGTDGKKHTPVMVHRAVLGSLDRFIGILIEQYAGKFPLWLNPVQVKVLPLADRFNEYAEKVCSQLREQLIRAEVDDRSESLNKKVREAQLAQINYILVVGEKEQKDHTVNIRTRDNVVHGEKKVDVFLNELLKEIKERRL
ncbi:threonine--tRNA ligase [Candidatus Woesearchaeota archaeon]|nr:threonine--tRNA ligase [Candidatus Woesearchaeota archaeon]